MTALDGLARRWRRRRVFGDLAAVAAAGWLAGWALAGWGAPGRTLLALVAALGLLLLAVAASGRWRLDPEGIARHLDRSRPEMEESSELLLLAAPAAGLARLQRARAERALERLAPGRLLPGAPLVRGGATLALAALLTWPVSEVAGRLAGGAESQPVPATADPGSVTMPPAGEVAPENSCKVSIEPPAYTGLSPRVVSGLTVEAPEGSRVEWRLRATPGWVAELVFEDGERRRLEPSANGAHTALVAERSRLYRLHLTSEGERPYLSPMARLAVIPDRPPELDMLEPRRLLEVSADAMPRLTLRALARDDFGLEEVVVVATLATGAGELVEFRERRLAFDRSTAVELEGYAEALELAVEIDARQLGLGAGGDLYLWAEAKDGRPEPQIGRSETVILRVLGERAAVVGLGEGLPVLDLPQAFRSQRQIILDTERLLAEVDHLAPEEVGRRSELLGFDQRALRMRYAGLLGEEFESGVAVGEEEAALAEAPEPDVEGLGAETRAAGLREAIGELPEGFVHFHDSALVATFFDDEVKAKLKGSMAEMWDAEGALRSHRPARALPHEYRALALLKDAQEAERVYVEKVGFEPPPLDLDRRLTGNIEEAEGSRRSEALAGRVASAIERVLVALAVPAAGERAPAGDLRQARELLALAAAESGGPRRLAALDSLARWIETGTAPPPEERELVEGVLRSLLPPPTAAPSRAVQAADEVFEAYVQRLGAGG